MRTGTVITETELELIHNVIDDWFRYYLTYSPNLRVLTQDYHRVLGLKHSLPKLNKDMEFVD